MLAEHFLQEVRVGAHGRAVDPDVGAHCSQRPATSVVNAESRLKLCGPTHSSAAEFVAEGTACPATPRPCLGELSAEPWALPLHRVKTAWTTHLTSVPKATFLAKLAREDAEMGWNSSALEATQGQKDDLFSQLQFRCYLPEVASVGG
jgi:hypothetical protein